MNLWFPELNTTTTTTTEAPEVEKTSDQNDDDDVDFNDSIPDTSEMVNDEDQSLNTSGMERFLSIFKLKA